MIYLLHGDNTTSIRNFILKLCEDNKIKVKHDISIEDVNPEDILSVVSSYDMFGTATLIALDITKMGRMNVEPYIDQIKNTPQDIIFVIYSYKELSKTNAFIKSAIDMKARLMPFKKIANSNVFKFCDAVFDKNRAQAYKELRNLLLEGEDAIYLLVMLSSSLRNISYAKFNSKEFDRLVPFIKPKVKTQASKFSESEIKYLYDRFYSLDVEMKSGLVSQDIAITLALESVFK